MAQVIDVDLGTANSRMLKWSVECKDYYSTLGVPSSANEDVIKRAYRKMARKYHPDSAEDKDVSEDNFKQIHEAYEILCDPQKKAHYDVLNAKWKEGVTNQVTNAQLQKARNPSNSGKMYRNQSGHLSPDRRKPRHGKNGSYRDRAEYHSRIQIAAQRLP